MTNKIINHLIYSSIFVSIVSSFLFAVTLFTFDKIIPINKVLLVFFGTLLIYNIDHLKDIKSDKVTNPERTDFIEKNKSLLKAIVVVSLLASTYLLFQIGIYKTLILIPAFFIGIFHWKLKKNKVFSILYITLSWTVVVTIFPLMGEFYSRKDLVLLTTIFGLVFMANASVFVASEHGSKTVGRAVISSKIIVVIALVIALLLSTEMRPLAFIPALTLIALIYYKPDERYNLFIMDGALLVGGLLSVLYKQFFTFL